MQKEMTMSEAANTNPAQCLTFKLGGEIFALDVARVREVLDLSAITKVPGTPEFMCGVINVRGSVVPVIDLKSKFGMDGVENSGTPRIVVMEPSINGETMVFGALADSVYEVVELAADQIELPPSSKNSWRTEFVRGIGKREDQFILLLNIDKVFSDDVDRIESLT